MDNHTEIFYECPSDVHDQQGIINALMKHLDVYVERTRTKSEYGYYNYEYEAKKMSE